MLDTEPGHQAAWRAAAADLGVILPSGVMESLRGLEERTVALRLAETLGGGLERQTAFWHRATRHWEAMISRDGVPARPGLAELREVLARRRIPCAIATNSPRRHALASLKAAGLDGTFPNITCRDDVAHGKPAPDVYLAALRRLGADPARTLAVEDSAVGLRAARTAGLDCVLIPPREARTKDPALSEALCVFEDLAQLARRLDTLGHRRIMAHDPQGH